MADKFPYVDSVQNVVNPYIQLEGENLLPPFSQWTLHANAKVISDYELELNATNSWQESFVKIPCLPNTQYSFNEMFENTNAYAFIRFYDASNVKVGTDLDNIKSSRSFTSPVNAKTMEIKATNIGAGTFKFLKPMLNIGSTAKPFVPRNPSYLYAECTLAGNDSKKDILCRNESLNPPRWEKTKWFEVDKVLDGSLGWTFSQMRSGEGYKAVYIPITALNNPVNNSQVVTKYNGIPLSVITALTGAELGKPDVSLLNSNVLSGVYIALPHVDSGFTDAMTPSNDLIKSYFYLWKYTGDGTNHKWIPIGDTDNSRETTVLPTSFAPTVAEGKVSPYKLTYQLASPVVEPVTVEGDLVVNGATQVTVNTGVIVKEKVNFVYFPSDSGYYFNATNVSGSELADYKILKILTLFENGIEKKDYTLSANSNSYGLQRIFIPKNNFDQTAEYSITYEILDKHTFTSNLTDVKATYANNIRSSLDDVVTKLSDVATGQTVNVRAIAELYKRVRTLEGV